MFKKAQKRAIRNMSVYSLFLLVITVGCLMEGGAGTIQLFKGSKMVTELDLHNMEGQYVTATFNWCMGDYAQELVREDGKDQVVAADYLIQLQNGKWIGARLRGEKMDQAEELVEACYTVLEEDSENWPVGFEITGAVIKMDRASVHYLKDFFNEAATIIGCYGEGEILPYVILVDQVAVDGKGYSISDAVVKCIISILSFILAVFLPIYGGLKLWKKELIRYCKTKLNPEATFMRLEEFADSMPDVGLIKMNEQWIMTNAGTIVYVMDTAHVVWVYLGMTKTKMYGLFTIEKKYSINFAKDDGKIITVNGSRQKIDESMKAVYQNSKHIMVGSDERLQQMYEQKNYAGLIALAKTVHQED